PSDLHLRPHSRPQQPRRAALPHRNLHRAAAPYEGDELPPRHVAERASERPDLRSRNADARAGLDQRARDVRDEGPEAVLVEHLAHERGASRRGAGSGVRTGSVIGWPRWESEAPIASWPAAGANTSRPWNVAAAPAGIGSETKCAAGGSGERRPLSGATKKCPAAPAASARR